MDREGAKLIEVNDLHEMNVSSTLGRGSPSKLARSPFGFLGIVMGNSILKKKKFFGLSQECPVPSITIDFKYQYYTNSASLTALNEVRTRV